MCCGHKMTHLPPLLNVNFFQRHTKNKTKKAIHSFVSKIPYENEETNFIIFFSELYKQSKFPWFLKIGTFCVSVRSKMQALDSRAV